MTTLYEQNAIGYLTKTAGWTNPGFNFIVGYAGGNWSKRADNQYVYEPNPNLKPIELQARAENKPFFALWDFDVAYYSNQQYMALEDKWPNLDMDYPYIACKNALAARDFDGLIVRVMDRNNDFVTKSEMMTYVSFAAKKFIERINKWLYTTKGLNKQILVMTSDPFVRQPPDNAQEYFYAWIKPDFPALVVEQAANTIVDNAYPNELEKPGSVGSASWKMWYYYWNGRTKNWQTEPKFMDRTTGLMLFNGDDEALKNFLGLNVTPPPTPDPDPEEPPVDMSGYVKKEDFNAAIESLEAEIDNLRLELGGKSDKGHVHTATVGPDEDRG